MKGRSIGYAEFAAAVAAEEVERFTFGDLDRFDYDPPKMRVALVSWIGEFVDEWGEVHSPRWSLIAGREARELPKLQDYGRMLFGDPPWKRSQILEVIGRLGSVEAAIAALVPPGTEFRYDFVVVEAAVSSRPLTARQVAATAAKPFVDDARSQRTRWRRTAKRDSGQGSLF